MRIPQAAVIVGLLATACVVQTWVVAHAPLTALDTVNFVGHAQLIERVGLSTAVREESAPPLYPLTILAARQVAELFDVEISWALAAQLAAAIPLVLCVLPVFALSRQVADQTAAVAATMLFIVMTQFARLGGDALSDSVHLLLFCTALAIIGRGLQSTTIRHQGAYCLVAGGCVSVALLARAEACILLPIVMLAQVCISNADRFTRSFACGAALALGVLLTFVPLQGAMGVDRPSECFARIVSTRGFVEESPLNDPLMSTESHEATAAPVLADGRPMQFGRKDPTVSIRFRGLFSALMRFVTEFVQSVQYFVGLLALVGLWRGREYWWSRVAWLHGSCFVVYSTAVLGFAVLNGYLERRHLLPVVVVLLPWAGRGALECGAAVARWLSKHDPVKNPRAAGRQAAGSFPCRSNPQPDGLRLVENLAHLAPLAAVALASLACLSTTLLPSHPGRTAHAQAADWLLANNNSGAVLDTVGHTALATGRKTYRHEIAAAALADPELQFLVIEQAELSYDSRRAATLRELVQQRGRQVATFSPPAGRAGPVVHVYQWQPDRTALSSRSTYAR